VAVAMLGVASFASAARAADASSWLAQKYAPVVRLVEQKERCKHGEAYVPTDVNLVLGNPDVALRGPWDKTNLIKVAPTARDLAAAPFDYHLDFPGFAPAPQCAYDEWSHRINQGHAPTAYAHIAADPAYPGRLALQYWFFYVFNDFNDKHEGDWEMIQLDFDATTPDEALRLKPALALRHDHRPSARPARRYAAALRHQRLVQLHQSRLRPRLRDRAPLHSYRRHVSLLRPPRRQATRSGHDGSSRRAPRRRAVRPRQFPLELEPLSAAARSLPQRTQSWSRQALVEPLVAASQQYV
jgi:hypothetical protein